jgi:hypothetical protein
VNYIEAIELRQCNCDFTGIMQRKIMGIESALPVTLPHNGQQFTTTIYHHQLLEL